jgi:RNA binding exosome subunit
MDISVIFTKFFSRVEYDDDMYKIHVKLENFHCDGHFGNIYVIFSRVEYDDDMYKIHVKVENFKPEELIVKTVDNTVQVGEFSLYRTSSCMRC